jgi:hypothetical protein
MYIPGGILLSGKGPRMGCSLYTLILCIHVYKKVCIYLKMYVYIYIYTYTYIDKGREWALCTLIYIYIYMYA